MQLSAGSTLLHYRIDALLGQGGMGAVYRAEDTKLRREVAIKVLPAEFTADPDRLARFDREARLLAALNHPHIATIHGVENVDGFRFIVMEHIAGETLAARLGRGAVPLDEALTIARQIAAALEAAHEKGVIHRDLKPANIIIDEEGRVKVLDFGLASSMAADSSDPDMANSPTIPHAGTHTGVILGTAGYMSPEQARGRKVDRRADVWAFGVVLWEMLTGRRLFAAETVSDTMAAILKEEPDWKALPRATPPALRRLLRRCLAKKASDRMRDFGDVRLELEEVDRADESVERVGPKRAGAVPWIVAAIALVVAGVATWRATRKPEPRLIKTIITSEFLQSSANILPQISPDGRRIAYSAGETLWIRALDELEPRKIPLVRPQEVLFWSPDSKWLAFISDDKVWKLAPGASAPALIAPVPRLAEGGTPIRFHSAAWGADDRIVLAQYRGGLYEMSASGGTAVEVRPPEPALVDFHDLSFLPDGKTLLAVPHQLDNRQSIEVIRDYKRQTVFTFRQGVVRGVTYSRTGHLLVSLLVKDEGVWAVPFSASTLRTSGKPFLVAAAAGACRTSDDGSLVYVANITSAPREIVRIDRSGKVTATIAEPEERLINPAVSPDERSVAVSGRADDNDQSIWLIEIATGARQRLTQGARDDRAVAWSPDGRQLLVLRDMDGNLNHPQYGVWLVSAGGSSEPRRIVHGIPASFTPDARHIVYRTFGARDASNIFSVPVSGGPPVEIVKSPFPKYDMALSPDGRFLAYSSIESGAHDIYLTRYPTGEGKWKVSHGGGIRQSWSHDGKTLYFVSGTRLMSVSFAASPEIRLGPPVVVFDGAPLNINLQIHGYSVLRNGDVIAIRDLPPQNRHVVLVQNWLAEFQK